MFDPVPSPGASSGLSATPGNGQVGLTWAAASGATGYGVHRSTTSGGPYTNIKSNIVGTSYTDTGVTNGTTYYYVVTATNAEGEGASSNQAPATPAAPTSPTTVTLVSIAAQDGWVLESGETTNVGGSINATATTTSALRAGDNNQDRQYKSVVSFDTSSIPDGATIVSVTLRLLRGTASGTNPFTTHGTCWVDVQSGSGFSGSTTLRDGRLPGRGDRRPGGEPLQRRFERDLVRQAISTPRASPPSTRRARRSSASISISTTTTTRPTTTSATTRATTARRPTGRSSW